MPAKKKAKRRPVLALVANEVMALKADLEREREVGRQIVREQVARTDQVRLERDGLLMLIALAVNGGGIAQVIDQPVRRASTLSPSAKER